jgi:hypothetical protein
MTAFLAFLARATRRRPATETARRALSQAGAASAVHRAAGLGLVNPDRPRRWSIDRKPESPVHRVIEDMPRHL